MKNFHTKSLKNDISDYYKIIKYNFVIYISYGLLLLYTITVKKNNVLHYHQKLTTFDILAEELMLYTNDT